MLILWKVLVTPTIAMPLDEMIAQPGLRARDLLTHAAARAFLAGDFATIERKNVELARTERPRTSRGLWVLVRKTLVTAD